MRRKDYQIEYIYIYYFIQLYSECQSELKRLMNIRSMSIGLMPEIEDNCIIDLATCKDPEKKGEVRKYKYQYQ